MNGFYWEVKNSQKFCFFFSSHIQNQLLSCRDLFLAKERGRKITSILITPGTYKASKVPQALFCRNVEAAEKTNGMIEKEIICKQKTVPSLQWTGLEE